MNHCSVSDPGDTYVSEVQILHQPIRTLQRLAIQFAADQKLEDGDGVTIVALHRKSEMARQQNVLIGHAIDLVLQRFGLRPNAEKRHRDQRHADKSDKDKPTEFHLMQPTSSQRVICPATY